ncbi:MAG: DNA polymerase III subunit gamma/tau [Clostridia bacterium]|nr:DNA polymerase III subunit gamma/tau [Clostridia bacterium]
MVALYRKYRPTTFDEVIAQEHITRTLINQINTNRVTHAYLFTGSRGTGKTTCARIFARAVNCLNNRNGSPCGECAVCKALEGGGSIDIVELDAASNNGVDQVREIVDNVQYPPVSGKYKVYIIDEVHMLTASAFNALLKTLEEPPAHSIFILATTEVHKLPATVLSRCMRFDFHLVDQETLKNYLKSVYKTEGVVASDDALNLIASSAEGSVRDMLSIADRCLNYSNNLTYEEVLGVLGASGKDKTRQLFTAIAHCNIGEILSVIDETVSAGKSVSLIAKDLCAYARDLLVLKTANGIGVIGSASEIEKMKAEAQEYTPQLLVEIINIFSGIDTELRYSVSPRIVLECSALRAGRLAVVDLSAIEERLTRLENKIENGQIAVAPAPTAVAKPTEQPVSTSSKPMDARSVWGRIITYIRLNENTRVIPYLERVSEVECKDGKLILWVEPENFLQIMDESVSGAVERAIRADGCPLKLMVNKVVGKVDMDSEIEKIKRLMDEAKLNIKK